MSEALILVNRDGWFRLAAGEYAEIPAWPKLTHQALAVTDFSETIVGVHRIEGKPAYAASLIEKHLRTQGLTDDAVHIVLHQVDRTPGGCQVLYSAVPLGLWQKTQAWAEQQVDHCMVVGMAGVLCDGLKSGQARIFRSGRSLHLAGRNRAGVFHYSADAIGNSHSDLEAAVRVMATHARADLAKGVTHPVQWACVATGDRSAEMAYAAEFSQAAGVACQLALHQDFSSTHGGTVLTALPPMCSGLGWGVVEASTLRRLAWRSEQIVAPLVASTLVVALALFAIAWVATEKAGSERMQAAQLLSKAKEIEVRVSAANLAQTPAGLAPTADFARQLGDGAAFDPMEMLQQVQRAAHGKLRIQRVKLEIQGERNKGFRVDGVASNASLTDITAFLSALHASGWVAEPLDPLEQSPGAFSYRLSALPKPRSAGGT